MARFNANDADKYGGQGGGGFFSIDKDKGVKQVRFLYETVDDITGMSVHKIKLKNKDGDVKDRYVNCLREYSDPMDKCPFCQEKKPTQARLLIPVYCIDDDEVQIWDRGKTMFQKLISVCERATRNGSSIVNHIFEVERNGKPKDKKTTYEIYDVDEDDTQLSDFELPEIFGRKGLVLDKTAEEMEYFLDTDEFPPVDDEDEEEDEKPVRRRESSRRPERAKRDDADDRDVQDDADDEDEDDERSSRSNRARAGRRTPSSRSSSRKEDKF